MNVRVIALYAALIPALTGRPGVRFRKHKKHQATIVPCTVKTIDGTSVATPDYAVPDGSPSPVYRAQFEILREPAEARRMVCAVLSAERHDQHLDPEQSVLSPIFNDGHRLIYEFKLANIMSVNHRGDVEVRYVAVHPVTGTVGTKSVYRFNTRFTGLVTRCVEHLSGAIDFFPEPPQRHEVRRVSIPDGEAALSFGGSDQNSQARTREARIGG